MMTCTRILSVEYYESMARQIKREAGLATPGTTLDDTAAAYARQAVGKGHKDGSTSYETAYTEAYDQALRTLRKEHSEGRDQVAYYTDNGAGEANGVWWTRSRSTHADGSPASRAISAPFRLCIDSSEVDGRVLRDLAQGRDPETKSPLVRQSATGKRSAGYDVQFAAPKSVSILAAFAEPEIRAKILAAHDRAVRRAMDHAFDAGLIVTRIGQGGKVRSPVEGAAAAVYRHFTSRAQDPQLHSHMVLLNLGVRPDGKTGGIDNKDVLRNAGGIAALYRSELASELRRELNVEVIRNARNFEVAGIPETVIELFSKRRAEIEKAARKGGFDTAESRGAAQVAAFETRAAKNKDIFLSVLEERWVRELGNAGWTSQALFEIARVEGERIRRERDGEGQVPEVRLAKLAVVGVTMATRTEGVIEHRHLLRHVAESLQCEASADEVLDAVDLLRGSGHLVHLGFKAEEPVYATPEFVEAEKSMLRWAYARQDEREFVPAAILERVLAGRTTMRAEQRAAVRHALNRDGVVVLEGSAGSGKSYAMQCVAAAARDAGAEVWTIAPSWKAVEVIRADTETAAEMARAVAGFLGRMRSGDIKLDRDTVVVADEAGMIATHDMHLLVEAVSQTGAKLVLVGDTRQLAPVAAGAPMRALATAVGTYRMTQIQRQQGRSSAEGAWMRAASMDFAAGRTVPALEAYSRAGAIVWAEDPEGAIDALVRDYAKAWKDPAREGRSRSVLTSWNTDVQSINARVRARLIEQGSLPTGEDIEIQAVPRGASKPVTLALRTGDDIIFGESVEIAGQTIRNADLGRIVRVEGDSADPVLTFTLAKNGATVTARVSALVGFREKGEARHPKIQHSYAMSVHASQGVTVDECFVLNTRGMQAEQTYVALTRHRETVDLYVDMSRIRDSLEARQTLSVSPEHRGMGNVSGRDQVPEVTAAEVRAAFITESALRGGKANAGDFLPEGTTLRAWASEPPEAPRSEIASKALPERSTVDGYPTLVAATDNQDQLLVSDLPVQRQHLRAKPPIFPQQRPLASAPLPAFSTPLQRPAEALGARMVARTEAKVAYPVPVARDPKGALLPNLERNAQGVAASLRLPAERRTMLARLRRAWHRIEQDRASNKYLLQVLKISRGVLERFRADIRTTRNGYPAFAHRDLEGTIVGFEVEGGSEIAENVGLLHEYNADTKKTFTKIGNTANPVRIYVAKSAVEGLSIFQADRMASRNLIVSFSGEPSAFALERFLGLVQHYPKTAIHIARDRDAAGQLFAEKIETHVREARRLVAHIVDRPPEEAFRTWNDQIQGWTIEDAARLTAKRNVERKSDVAIRKPQTENPHAARNSPHNWSP